MSFRIGACDNEIMDELEKQTFLFFSHILNSMTLFFEGTAKWKETHSKVCYAKQNENS